MRSYSDPLAYTQTFTFDCSSNRLTLSHDDRRRDGRRR